MIQRLFYPGLLPTFMKSSYRGKIQWFQANSFFPDRDCFQRDPVFAHPLEGVVEPGLALRLGQISISGFTFCLSHHGLPPGNLHPITKYRRSVTADSFHQFEEDLLLTGLLHKPIQMDNYPKKQFNAHFQKSPEKNFRPIPPD